MGETLPFSPGQRVDQLRQFETTQVNGKIYEIDTLRDYAETLPMIEIPLDKVRGAVGEGHVYWIDRNGEPLAPYQIIQDWDAAQINEAWADHVTSIKRANLDDPIWSTPEGHIFDGVHRLTRAVIDRVSTVKMKIFESLPDSAQQRSKT